MFASHTDTHQDVVTIIGSGSTIDEAIQTALRELTQQTGRHDNLHFKTFEIVQIEGTIDSPGPARGGKLNKFFVELKACGTHINGQKP